MRGRRRVKTIKVSDITGSSSYTLTLDLSGQVLRLDIPRISSSASRGVLRQRLSIGSFSELKGPESFCPQRS